MVSKTKRSLPKECKMKGKGYCPRPLECATSFLSKKWTISLLFTIGNFNKLRFNHLFKRIEGISAKILSERLSELEEKKIDQTDSFS